MISKNVIYEKISLSVRGGGDYVLQKKTTFSSYGKLKGCEYSEESGKLFSVVTENLWIGLKLDEEIRTISINKGAFKRIISECEHIFICPKCGGLGIDHSLGDASVLTHVLSANEGEYSDLGEDTITDGTFNYYQCADCGFILDCEEDGLYSYVENMKDSKK